MRVNSEMNTPDMSSSTPALESEESLWQKLEDAFKRYQAAAERYRELLEKERGGKARHQDDPLALAWRAECETLAEYTNLVKMFTESRGCSRKPQKLPAAKANGG